MTSLDTGNGWRLNWQAIWKWIDRDLDQPRPLSGLLMILPFIPFAVALEATDDAATHDAFLLGGMAVALPWFAYVIWRGLKVVGRSFRDTANHFRDPPLDQPQSGLRIFTAFVVVAIGGMFIYWRNFT